MAEEQLDFMKMTEEQMQHFVESNPDRVNEWDVSGRSVLFAAVEKKMSPTFLSWILENGADLRRNQQLFSKSLLHEAGSAEVVDIFLQKGVNPVQWDKGIIMDTPLMAQCREGRVDCIERLLREPSVMEHINLRNAYDFSALALICRTDQVSAGKLLQIIEMLLYAGADPTPRDEFRAIPLEFLRQKNPDYHATFFLSPRGYYLTKARHISAAHHAVTRATPSFLLPRMPPLPHVDLVTPPSSSRDRHADNEQEVKKTEETRMAVLRFVLGQDEKGTPGGGMLQEHFVEVILLMCPVSKGYQGGEEADMEGYDSEGNYSPDIYDGDFYGGDW
jgi:hypothetical protein